MSFFHRMLETFLNVFEADLFIELTAFCTPPFVLKTSPRQESLPTVCMSSPSSVLFRPRFYPTDPGISGIWNLFLLRFPEFQSISYAPTFYILCTLLSSFLLFFHQQNVGTRMPVFSQFFHPCGMPSSCLRLLSNFVPYRSIPSRISKFHFQLSPSST